MTARTKKTTDLGGKLALRDELVARLKERLETAERAQRAAAEAATHEEARPENDKDTRGLEQSYVARGQAARVGQLREAVSAIQTMPLRAFTDDQPVAVGALITAEEDDRQLLLFLAPQGGGTMLAGGTVRVVTLDSPLGQALLGKEAGDECDVQLDGRVRTLALIAVA